MPTMTDLDVRAAPIGEHTDGDGLNLVVRASRSGGKPRRAWVLRITDGGRRRKLGLGSYPSVTLALARQKAVDARRSFAEGKDPSQTAKRLQQAANAARTQTLIAAIDGYLANAAPKFKNAQSAQIRDRALRIHFAPLHSRDVTSIATADIASILRPLAAQTAIKTHSAIRAVFDYAATVLEPHGVSLVNPADPRRLRSLGWSPASPRSSVPHPSLDWRRMPEFMAELALHDDADARCLEFIILTASRAGAARLAKWANIDLERRVWSVPIADLKDSKHRTAPFAVPLSSSAVELLKALPRNGAFLFPTAGGRPIGTLAIVYLMRRLRRRGDWLDPVTGQSVTTHGFRASFRTWAKAQRKDREIAELNLGHAFYTSSEGAYARDDDAVLALRGEMLEAWARHCAGQRAEIVAFPSARA
jgi:integrase